MFDYAISMNQGRRPKKRIYASLIASCLIHCILILLLIQFPQLLQGGIYRGVRIILGAEPEDSDQNWRTVTVLEKPSKMLAPSITELRKLLAGLNKKGTGAAPIRIPIKELLDALQDNPPASKGPQEPKDSPPSTPNPSASTPTSVASGTGDKPAGSSSADQNDPGAGTKEIGTAITYEPAPKTEVAENKTPTKIPDSIKPQPVAAPESKDPQTSQIESRDTRGSALFDTKGFPLNDYADFIIDRIHGNWFIPSNLRESQGHATVVFYIDKQGRYANARIARSSGSSSFDLTALNAIIESNPFPPLPKGFPGERVGVRIVFSYREPH
jgi:TonB family protein